VVGARGRVEAVSAEADQTVFLGVDGGGTKTAYCLLRATGELLAEHTDGPSIYPLTGGPEHTTRVLVDGIASVCDTAGLGPAEIAYAFFGIPTYGEVSEMLPGLDAAPRVGLGHDRYRCDNDMVCGWAGSLAGGDGINVVSGTGSMTYGERRGVGARVGGWGHLFGDEGSAYWIAVRGLNACSRMSDGRLARGPLLEAMLEHVQIEAELDLVDVILRRWGGDRAKVAALCRIVAAAAELGDPHAVAIFADAGDELAQLIEATWRRLGGGADEAADVSYSGGVFASGSLITDPLRDALARRPGEFTLRRPRYAPRVGAAIHAARLHGTPLTARALARLDAQIQTRAAAPAEVR
jgi:N-acetylglucosamine kinase-like BadF-type ATPase